MADWQRQGRADLWFWKIPDYTRPGYGYSNDRAVDVVACYRGMFVGLEWKLQKNDRALPIDRVREGQVETLLVIEACGGVGLLMVAVYKGARDKCVYAIPIREWVQAVACESSKSIRIAERFPHRRIDQFRSGSFVHWNMKPVEELINANRC